MRVTARIWEVSLVSSLARRRRRDERRAELIPRSTAGTMCKDGAITWDTADEASTDDSSSASSEVESFASTSVVIAEAAASPSSSSSSIVLHNAAVNTDTSSSYVAPTTTSAPAAETSSSSSDWDDEGDCEEESSDSDDGWTSTTSKAPVANYATTSSTKAYVAPTTSSEYKAPSSSSTTQYVAPTTTTTTQAAATTSSPDSGSGASSEVFTGGRGTFYCEFFRCSPSAKRTRADLFLPLSRLVDQYGAYGACGQIHADSDPIVALAIARELPFSPSVDERELTLPLPHRKGYGTGSNNAPDCGRKVVVTNVANGKSVTATVADVSLFFARAPRAERLLTSFLVRRPAPDAPTTTRWI